MDTDKLVTDVIIDCFGLSDLTNKMQYGGASKLLGVAAKGLKGIVSKGAKGIGKGAKQYAKSQSGKFSQGATDASSSVKRGAKSTKGQILNWATQPGPGKPIENDTFTDYTEKVTSIVVKIFTTLFFILTLPLRPWIWVFKKSTNSLTNSYKESLRPL